MAKVAWKPCGNTQIVFGADVSIVDQDRRNFQNGPDQNSFLNSTDSKYAVFGHYQLSHGIWDFGMGLRYEADRMNYTDGASGARNP